MSQLIRFGEVRQGRIGVVIQDLTPDLAVAMRPPGKRGAVLSYVEPTLPAAKAGLKSGDVIVAVDNIDIANSSDLCNRIGLTMRGTEIKLTYLRDGKQYTKRVEIGELEETSLPGDEDIPRLGGATFTAIPEVHPAKGDLAEIFVKQTKLGSPAWTNGLREGDIILAINRRMVTTVAELSELSK